MNEEIKVRFEAKTDAIDRAMRKLEGGVKIWAKQVAGYVAGAFAVTGAISGAQKLIDYIDRLGDQAQNLGVSTDFLQGFFREVGMAGGNADEAGRALNKFFQNIGNGDVAFKKFGITLKDGNGRLRNNEEILGDVAEALSTAENGSKRAAMAAAFFGKQWEDVALALQGGRAAIMAMGESSVFKIDAGMIEQLNLLKDSLTGKSYGLTGLLSQIFSIPVKLSSALSSGLGSVFGGGTFQQGLEELAGGIAKVNATGGLQILSEEQIKALEKADEILSKSLAGYEKAKFDAADKQRQVALLKKEREENEKNLKALEAINKNEFAEKSSARDAAILRAKTAILELDGKIAKTEKAIADEKDRQLSAERRLADAKKKAGDQFKPTLGDLAGTSGPNQGRAQRAMALQEQIRAAHIAGNSALADRLTTELYGGELPDSANEAASRRSQNYTRRRQGLKELGPKLTDGLIPDLMRRGMADDPVVTEINSLKVSLEEILKHEGITVKGA